MIGKLRWISYWWHCGQNLSLIMLPFTWSIQTTLNLEIAHARAVGRGKAAEADAAWGENLANQVLTKERVIMQDPVA